MSNGAAVKAWPEDSRINLWDLLVNAVCRLLCLCLPWRARVVPRADDPSKPLLTQFLLYKAEGVSIYLQHFEAPEAYEYFHRHRWSYMRSLILSGMYLEERPWTSFDGITPKAMYNEQRLYMRLRFRSHTMDHDTIHRVDYWAPLCWTLFYTRDPSNDWGYYPRGDYSDSAFIPWKQFVKARVPSLETGKVTE